MILCRANIVFREFYCAIRGTRTGHSDKMPERFKVTKTAEADVEYASANAGAAAAGRHSPTTPLDEEAALGHRLLGGDKNDGKQSTSTFYTHGTQLCAHFSLIAPAAARAFVDKRVIEMHACINSR